MGFWDGMGAGILGGVGSLIGGFAKAKLNRDMFRHQKEFDRYGVSIRAQDMERAGLSKTLAAGNPATTSVQSDAANALNPGDAIEQGLASAAAAATVAKTRAETGLTEELQRKAKQDTAMSATSNASAQYDLQIRKKLEAFNIQQAKSRTTILKTRS